MRLRNPRATDPRWLSPVAQGLCDRPQRGDSEEATGAQFFPCQLVLTCLRALNVNGPAARP